MGSFEMIILDTHVWVWWNDQNSNLTADYQKAIRQNSAGGIGISVISCWEIAKLVEKNRLQFSIPVEDWLTQGLSRPSIQLLPLTTANRRRINQTSRRFSQRPG